MNINHFIENIQRQPAHIRMRYAIIFTAISMVFILIIWIISFKSIFNSAPDPSAANDSASQKENTGSSLEDLTKILENAENEAYQNQINANDALNQNLTESPELNNNLNQSQTEPLELNNANEENQNLQLPTPDAANSNISN